VGTRQDLAEGVKWLQRAARQGDAKAQYNLGVAYRDGEGVRQNRRQARSWLERAAKQGHKKATRVLKSLNLMVASRADQSNTRTATAAIHA